MNTPAQLGYRMPAEWEPHAGTWLSWPRREGISFPGRFDEILPAYSAMVKALSAGEGVFINVCNEAHETEARSVLEDHDALNENITFHHHPTNEPWCRDHGPIFVKNGAGLAVINWGYNAWGGKYPPFDNDNTIPSRIAETRGLTAYNPSMILEGGSIEVNGAGTLLTTESCLLNHNRNPNLTRDQIEQNLHNHLGVSQIYWLGDGIDGDDTDGHIDDLARFVNSTTIVTAVEPNSTDPNHTPLAENRRRLEATPFEIIELPMPPPLHHEGERLPASYANFYVGNTVVLLPTFNCPTDTKAEKILQNCFPTREIKPIDSTALLWGLGSFHCLTQQEPAAPCA